MAPARRTNMIVVLWGTLEILLFAGSIFGWASLVYVLKAEGYFSAECWVDNGLPIVQAAIPKSDLALLNSTARVTTETTHLSPSTDHGESNSNKSDILSPSSNDLNVDTPGGESTPTYPEEGKTEKEETGGYRAEKSDTFADCRGVNGSELDCLDEGIHPHRLVPTCNQQDEHFNLVYTLAVVITGVSLFATGWMFDRFGTRVCRVVGIVSYLSGTLMTAFSTPDKSLLLYPAISLFSFGGYFILLTNMQLGNLIPEKRSTIISLYCGAFDSSAFMLVLVKFAYEGGFSTRASFLFLSSLFSIVIISTFWFLPRYRVPHPIPEGYALSFIKHKKQKADSSIDKKNIVKEKEKNGDCETESSLMKKEAEYIEGDSELPLTNPNLFEIEKPTFLSIAKTSLYIWDVVWLSCHRFQSWSFVGRLNPALTRLANGDRQIVSQYTSVYASMQFFGIFIAPLSGRLMDRRKKEGNVDRKIERVEMSIASFVLDSTVGLLLSIATCIPILEVQYFSFLLHVVHRACLYGPNTAFIAQSFPAEHFGKLFGFAMSFAAAVSLIQYPIFILIQDKLNGDPLAANLFTMVLMVFAYGHPLHIWRWCRQEKRKLCSRGNVIYKPKQQLAHLQTANPVA